MNKSIRAGPRAGGSQAFPLALFLLLLVSPVVLAERVTVHPETELSLDFSVEGATSCILVPEAQYDARACQEFQQKAPSARRGDPSLRALVLVGLGEKLFVLTVSSVSRPGIGQMYDQQIQGFIEGTHKRLSEDFGAPVRAVNADGKAYTVQQAGGIPVARWEFTTELPDSDERANTASAVVYLIPSKDTLDIFSVHAHRRNLEMARSVGEQVISTLRVPLTIDAEKFGADMVSDMARSFVKILAPLVLMLVATVWLWRRSRKARSG